MHVQSPVRLHRALLANYRAYLLPEEWLEIAVAYEALYRARIARQYTLGRGLIAALRSLHQRGVRRAVEATWVPLSDSEISFAAEYHPDTLRYKSLPAGVRTQFEQAWHLKEVPFIIKTTPDGEQGIIMYASRELLRWGPEGKRLPTYKEMGEILEIRGNRERNALADFCICAAALVIAVISGLLNGTLFFVIGLIILFLTGIARPVSRAQYAIEAANFRTERPHIAWAL